MCGLNQNLSKMSQEKDKIAKAVIQVMQAVKGMEKKAKIGTGNSSYDGTKDQDVKEVFNEEMAKAGLCILPTGIEATEKVERWEEEDQYSKSNPKPMKTKQSVFTAATTKYMLLHESGQSIELAGYGHGIDAQDKGAGKATTYALKNCLLLTFLTPVGKMPDTDTTHSNEIETPKQINLPVLKMDNKKSVGEIVKYLAKNGNMAAVRTKWVVSPKVEEQLRGLTLELMS